MLDVLMQQGRDRQGVIRRDFLHAGFLGLGGLTLGDLFRLRASASSSGNGTKSRAENAVIMLYLRGGASHLETYDMKPLAPEVIRGPFKPIAGNVSGIEVCEHLPEHARRADRFALIRSCAHEESEHTHGIARTLTGYGQSDVEAKRPIHPEIGSVVTRAFSEERLAMPPAIVMGANYFGYITGAWNGYWPLAYRPPMLRNGKMEDVAPVIDGRRIDDRLSLLRSLDDFRRDTDISGSMDAMDRFNRQAVDIVTGTAARQAFDLSLEDEATRRRYGGGWGEHALLARRLVESGVNFVTVSVPGRGPKRVATNWDDHAGNWDISDAMLDRLPDLDRIVGALIDDLYSRGLSERVMLVVMGEFGRTPRMNRKNGNWGRDHWPGAGSILVSGGGVKTGQVIGATNKHGEYPSERPIDPHDMLATVYRHLGLDHKREYPDAAGRPIPITRGEPIAELF